jgi:hypothetical protein
MALWHVTLRLPEGDRRSQLRDLRSRSGVVIRGVYEHEVEDEVGGADEAQVRRDWAHAAVLSVLRIDAGWSGDWWDGEDPETLAPDYRLGPAADGPDAQVLIAVPFHHFRVDGTDRRLTLFWHGFASCEPGPAMADERDESVIVTVTERRPGGALAAAGVGRRSVVELRAPLGDRPVWDRQPGAVRPLA